MMLNKFKNWWFTEQLPQVHLKVPGRGGLFNYLLRWLIHPVKRKIARIYLAFLERFFGIKIIGITGSAGKTTTKEMVASILKLAGPTVYSYANIDPVYNLPTTILRARPWTKFLVLEMGIEYPGEMDFYLWLAKPDVGIITSINLTHTEFLGDIKGVAREKGKLIKNLARNNFAVLNKEDPWLRKISRGTKAKIIWVGKNGKIKAERIVLKESGSTEFRLVLGRKETVVEIPVLGRQFVNNALMAAAVATLYQIPLEKIVRGLENFTPQEHRMRVFKHKSGALIIDDSYNSNPLAVREALKTFLEIAPGRKKIAVLGDMLELGKYERACHRDLGKTVSVLGIEYLIGVGRAAEIMVQEARKKMGPNRVKWFAGTGRVTRFIKKYLKKDCAILIKGSRSIGLDKLVDAIINKA